MKRFGILASASLLLLATLAVGQDEGGGLSRENTLAISADHDLAFDVAAPALGPCIAIHALRVDAVEAFAYIVPVSISAVYAEAIAGPSLAMPIYFRGGESFVFERMSKRNFHGNYFPVGSRLNFRPRNQPGTTGHYRNC